MVLCTTLTRAGLGLQKNSEFLQLFNYHLLKQFEHGIMMRRQRRDRIEQHTNQDFGIAEAAPLGWMCPMVSSI